MGYCHPCAMVGSPFHGCNICKSKDLSPIPTHVLAEELGLRETDVTVSDTEGSSGHIPSVKITEKKTDPKQERTLREKEAEAAKKRQIKEEKAAANAERSGILEKMASMKKYLEEQRSKRNAKKRVAGLTKRGKTCA